MNQQLTIRLMSKEDLGLVLAWRNHENVRTYMFSQHEISIDEHQSWFEKASQDAHKHLLLAENDREPMGFVQFHEQTGGGVADWGFYTAPEAPTGTGLKLGQAALHFGYDTLGLHKVCGQALEFNERSIKLHLRLGFQREGVLREQYFDGRQYQDLICFGLLSAEWKSGG